MIRKNIILFLFILSLLSACSKIDNYKAPDGGVYGKLLDLMTNEGIQTEQPNGYNIKLFEKGRSLNSPVTFSGKPDGTFENVLIFQNEYKVLPVEGAFFPITDTAVVQIGDRTEINFSVMPFLSVINVTVTPGTNKVTVVYNIARNQVGGKITTRKAMLSKVPTVSNAFNNLNKTTSTTSITDVTLLATTFTDEITGTTAFPLVSGKTYWVRVGALATGSGYNSLNRYNYSKIIQVTMP
jgi:hypothetical protein